MSAPLKVLFVEDEPDIRAIARLALETLGGFEVIECRSGAEAVARAREVAADVLLLDVMMPDMDGPATLAALRALPQAATTPAIFMTAKVQPAEVRGYLALGAVGVISKPFDPMTLAAEVQRLCREAQGAGAIG